MIDYNKVKQYEYELFIEPIRSKRIESLYGFIKDGLIDIEEFGLLLDRCSPECTEYDNKINKRYIKQLLRQKKMNTL